MSRTFSDDFLKDQKFHEHYAHKAFMNEDPLMLRYHTEVLESQYKFKRPLYKVEKQIIFFNVFKIKLIKDEICKSSKTKNKY